MPNADSKITTYASALLGQRVPQTQAQAHAQEASAGESSQSAQSSALATAARKTQQPLFASPKASTSANYLTPASKALMNKPGGVTPQDFTSKKDELIRIVESETNQPRRPKAVRGLDKALQEAKTIGEMHAAYANRSDQHSRSFSRAVATVFKAPPIETQSIASLGGAEPGVQADYAQFKALIEQMSGAEIRNVSDVANFLTCADPLLGGETKNVLLTVVSFPENRQLRFLSLSGNVRPMNDLEDGVGSVSVRGNAGTPTELKCQLIPPSRNSETTAIKGYANTMLESLRDASSPVYYVGYRDLSVRIDGKQKEWRGIPKLGTRHRFGGIHDRARDTEYLTLSGLSIFLRENPDLIGKPMDVRMFSKYPMCTGCETAATYASLQSEFAGLTSFRIYGGTFNH
ncbi:MAG TPA: hypothetical protein VFV43_03550 [Limnobacter sp.]|nr:hypothetical protein [Limnobacter sp.]